MQGSKETEMMHKGNRVNLGHRFSFFKIWFINKPFSIGKTHDNFEGD